MADEFACVKYNIVYIKYRLPSNWSASRDAFDGRIQYRNKMTGLRQYVSKTIQLQLILDR